MEDRAHNIWAICLQVCVDANHECIQKTGKAASLAKMFNKRNGKEDGTRRAKAESLEWLIEDKEGVTV